MKTTINGQLLLLNLVENLNKALSSFFICELNTDGTSFKCKRSEIPIVERIISEFEQLTKLQFESVIYKKMIIRDVNNYICETDKGEIKHVGMFQYKKLALNKNASELIIPKALEAYFISGIKPDDYLNQSNDVFDYLTAVKAKRDSWFDFVDMSGNIKKLQKVNRYFISTGNNKGRIMKRYDDGRTAFVEATKCYQTVYNTNDNKNISSDIDKSYYLKKIYK
jgi:hypothetical protein